MQPKPGSSAEETAGAGTSGRASAEDEIKAGPRRVEFRRGEVEGVVVRELRRFTDARGWLSELFREDEVAGEFRPAMAYVSATLPGVCRGPHEHREQADYFCFLGPSNFELRLWDNRPGSATFGNQMTLRAGEERPLSIIIPAGVVHAYRNIGDAPGLVINLPDRLYAGAGRREAVDEIRHEDDPATPFRMD
jgi:dTDP-4-dehydrorhamnose 3,5-epimerase